MMDRYVKALQEDDQITKAYYQKSVICKTEQQKVLEKLILQKQISPKRVADIACGGGGASVHLANLWPDAEFMLIDANASAIEQAKTNTSAFKATCALGDIYNLHFEDNSVDLVICWQTLSWLENPEMALSELIRICKPGGRLFLSSLFNLNHDVDIYSRVIDHTRLSASQPDLYLTYNTYSEVQIRKWIGHRVSAFTIHPFDIGIDLEPSGRGIASFTVKTDYGKRLQISGGMLLNWGILEIEK